MNSVAIIGAGITGLTAAFRLQQLGVPVTIYEAGERAGGVVQSTRRDGFLVESGPNTLLETSPIISELVRDLGLAEQRIYTAPEANRRYIVRDGRLVALPSSAPAFLTSPAFSIAAKLRLACEPFIRRGSDPDESLASFVVRRIGREFLDYAINPFVAGVYAGDPARLSVRHAFPKLHAVEQRHGSLFLGQWLGARERRRSGEVSKRSAPKFSFPDGLQALTEAFARAMNGAIQLRTSVERVTRAGQGWRVTALSGARAEQRHSAVLFAAPAHRLAQIYIETLFGRASLEPLADMRYAPVTTLALGFRRDQVAHPLDGFGVLIPEVERRHILGALFNSSLFPGRAPANHVLLTCYLGGTRAPATATLPLEEQVSLALRDLEALLGARGRPVFVHRAAFRQAIPQYEVGFDRFKDLISTLEKEPGLHFAGHYRDGISLGDCILSGHRVAQRIAATLTNEPHAPAIIGADVVNPLVHA